MLKKLQKLLEGKTILKIDPPNASEAICKFVLTDGTAFRLHATELGFWIEETEGSNGYSSLNSLMTDYGHHVYNLGFYMIPDAKITIADNLIEFEAPDGKLFIINSSKLSFWEQKIINNPKGLSLLEAAGAMGEYWLTYFRPTHNEDCPEELHYKGELDE